MKRGLNAGFPSMRLTHRRASRLGAGVLILFQAVGAPWVSGGEPILLDQARATLHVGAPAELDRVINGIDAEAHGWSVTPRLSEPHALVVRCAKPVRAAALDFTLSFRSGRPNSSILELALSYTTDAEPSLSGNWAPLEIQRFTAEVVTLQRTERGHLRASYVPAVMTGVVPDDTYRVSVLLPGGLAGGFRLDVFPARSGAGVVVRLIECQMSMFDPIASGNLGRHRGVPRASRLDGHGHQEGHPGHPTPPFLGERVPARRRPFVTAPPRIGH